MTAPPALASALKGRYRIERELGVGGMATVYLAEDRKHERHVAVKVLHPELAASLGSERFLREIRIIARLAHPYILPLIDSGEAAGFLYYVTPHVPDGSLRERLATGPLDLERALSIVREVGSALDFAHRQGFLHRDVKPENILFTDGHAVLADFGVARALGKPGDALTEVGFAVGTPIYMSPEQAAGDKDVGARSDAYSLAVVAYEMLAGEPPLKGDGARATIAKHLVETPRPLRAVRPEAPAHVERALARALAKDPGDRFPTVADLVTALDEQPAGPLPTLSHARIIAVLPFVNASADPGNEYLSDGITEELIDALAKLQGLRVCSRSSVFALKGKPADARAVGALLGASWVIEGSVRRAGDKLRITAQLASTGDGNVLWSERFDRTLEDVFAIQEEIARTIVDTLRRTTLADIAAPQIRRRTSNLEAYQLYLKGRYLWNRRTQTDVSEAIDVFKQAIAADPGYAQAYAGLSDAYALNLDYRNVPVAEGFAHAMEYARQAIALDDTVAEAHASLAWVLFVYEWQWDESRREFRRAIELDPSYATARQWYSFWLVSRGHIEEAMAEIHRAHELDPASISIGRSVGWIYYYARRFEQAHYYLERANQLNPLADENYRVAGLIYAAQERFDDAERSLRQAISLAPDGTYTPGVLAYVLGRAGRTAEAEAIQRQLEERARTDYVSPVAFATMHLGLGNWDTALDWMEKARAERRGWMAYLRVLPILDPVRSQPRFAALLKAMNL